VGKVRICSCQPRPGHTNVILIHREAPENPRSSTLHSGWTCRCVFGPISDSRLFNVFASKIRPRKQERPTSTTHSVQMIIIILSSTSLDLNLAMPRACDQSGISYQTVLTRADLPRKDCMPSGRESTRDVTLKLPCDLLICLIPGYVSPRPMPLMGALEKA
jgi:hypothetical protein